MQRPGFDLIMDTDLSYAEVLRRSQEWINKVKRSLLAEPAPAQPTSARG